MAGSVVATEGRNATIVITATPAPAADVVLQLISGSGAAQPTERGTGRDLSVPSTVVFKAGTTSVSIEIPTLNDEIRELDETLAISILRASDGKTIGNVTVTIVDDDRKAIVDIRSTGATGNGVTDDTAAVQSAVDQVIAAGGGVVRVPPGTYMVTSVTIAPGLSFIGEGGVLKRPAGQGKWVRTLTTDGNPYSGTGPSAPLVIQGMIFDGNRQQQSEYRNWELEQAHLVMLSGDPSSPGQLRAFVDRTTFHDGVGDGLSIYTNVNVRVTDVVATDVFRGGLVVTGGNSDVLVDGLTTRGHDLVTGVDFEIDGRGFNGSLAVRALLSNLDIDADFDLGLGQEGESRVIIDRLVMHKGPFTSFTPNSKVTITNSSLQFGSADSYNNRLLFPTNMLIENSKIVVTPDTIQNFAAVDVWFEHQNFSGPAAGLLRFRNVDFVRGLGSGSTFAVYRRLVRSSDQIAFENVKFDASFTKPVGP
jgi:Pectate lyase superfamily protein